MNRKRMTMHEPWDGNYWCVPRPLWAASQNLVRIGKGVASRVICLAMGGKPTLLFAWARKPSSDSILHHFCRPCASPLPVCQRLRSSIAQGLKGCRSDSRITSTEVAEIDEPNEMPLVGSNTSSVESGYLAAP